MRTLTTLLCLILCLGALGAAAQDRPSNRIGLYFDLNTREDCVLARPGSVFEAYLLMDHLSHTQRVLGWELNVSVAPAQSLASFEYAGPGGSLFTQTPLGDVAVTYPEPYLASSTGQLLLVTYHFWAPAGGQLVEYFIGPHTNPTHDPSPGFLALVGGVQTWIPLYIVSGSADLPVAVVNGPDCTIVQDEVNTWGCVKSLYR